LFGTTFGKGCRYLPPQKGEGIRKLVGGDIVNIVDVLASENRTI
jgi:hypothetical protein